MGADVGDDEHQLSRGHLIKRAPAFQRRKRVFLVGAVAGTALGGGLEAATRF